MKSFRLLLALATAGFFFTSLARAGNDQAKPAEKTCHCPKDKDGKVCGKDKDCCCTGEKCAKEEAKDSTAGQEAKK